MPQILLMLRKCDMYSFFLQNKMYDSKTSYASTFDASSNRYTFSNIASLVSHCHEEYKKGISSNANWEAENPDWNKVVLIPISVATDNNTGSTMSISHNHNMTSARLQGGDTPIALSIVTSKFNNE